MAIAGLEWRKARPWRGSDEHFCLFAGSRLLGWITSYDYGRYWVIHIREISRDVIQSKYGRGMARTKAQAMVAIADIRQGEGLPCEAGEAWTVDGRVPGRRYQRCQSCGKKDVDILSVRCPDCGSNNLAAYVHERAEG
jgi:hypothetical protein